VSATIREIVNEALTVVGEVSGPGVQLYEDDRMKADAIRAFNMMFKKYNWTQYLRWYSVVLDGVTGKPTTGPFEQVKDFEDFVAVHRNQECYPLPIAPTRLNPYSFTASAMGAAYWTSLPATDVDYVQKKIMAFPITAVGTINVLAKEYPLVPPATQFDWNQSFFLDKDMLVYATAFMTLSGDDLNAGAADVVKNLMEMKYRDVLAALSSHPIPIDAPYAPGDSTRPTVVVPATAPSVLLGTSGHLLLR
jgi:hypothetical protein